MSCNKHYNWTTDTPCPYCRIDELEQDHDGWIRNYELQEKVVEIAQQRVAELEQQLSSYQSKYHNLLAVAHRDGGQYLALHGEEKAGEAAITAILTAYHNNDRYQGGIEVELKMGGYFIGSCSAKIDLPESYASKKARVHVMEVE